VAGVGVGLVIYFAPRLLDSRWQNPTTWASILLPVIGPGVISAASMVYAWSLPLGVATSLLVARLAWQRQRISLARIIHTAPTKETSRRV
jgi:hypothetical protein